MDLPSCLLERSENGDVLVLPEQWARSRVKESLLSYERLEDAEPACSQLSRPSILCRGFRFLHFYATRWMVARISDIFITDKKRE